MSLRARINLLITALTLLFFAAGAYLMIGAMREQIHEEIKASNRVTTQLMTAVLYSSSLFARDHVQQSVVQDFLQRLGRVRANEIRLYDHHGTRVFTSPPSVYKTGRDAPPWFSELVDPELPPVRLHASSFTVEIVPDASRSVLDAWDNLMKLAGLAAIFFALINVLVYAVVGRAVRPLHTVVQAFSRAGRGDLSARLPHYTLPELRAIGSGFNHMLTELQRTMAAERELLENRQLTHVIQSHLEEERRVLARELHDEIGQYLTAIKTLAQATANRSERSDPQTLAASRAIVDSAGRIYDAMHRIIRRLRPMALERMGLADTLRDAASEWRDLHPQISFDLDLPEQLPRLGDETEIALFRIAQESVTNAARHARATRVRIAVTADAQCVHLSVADDGAGIDPQRQHAADRYGLLGMRERAQGLGGTLSVRNTDTGGTTIVAELPIKTT